MLKKAVDYFIAVIALALFTSFVYDMVNEFQPSIDNKSSYQEQYSKN